MTPRKHPPRRQPPRRAPRSRRVGPHVYPEGWHSDDWVVPFGDGEHACIHHGHEDPEDHSLCGPIIFCCLKAAAMYMDLAPESAEAHAEWELTEAAHIATWMEPSDRGPGANVLFFVFCDPVRPDGLLAIGLERAAAREVLLRRVPLERYAGEAERLR